MLFVVAFGVGESGAALLFFVDWDAAGTATAARLRAEAAREPRDRALRELVGELSTLSPESASYGPRTTS